MRSQKYTLSLILMTDLKHPCKDLQYGVNFRILKNCVSFHFDNNMSGTIQQNVMTHETCHTKRNRELNKTNLILRSSLSCDVMQCRLVVSYQHFGTIYQSHLQG
jgi:hypothetical protein